MKRITIIVMIFFVSCKNEKDEYQMNQALVKRIDHILLMPEPSKARAVYDFFINTLKMPVAWPYDNWGEFSTGAAFFGNVPVEIIESVNRPETGSNIVGFALEPGMKTGSLIREMDKQGIKYRKPYLFEIGKWIFKKKMWTSTIVDDVLPDSQIFFCEYHMDTEKKKKKIREEFLANNGGPLCIEKVEEVKIYLNDFTFRQKIWSRLLSPINMSNEGIFVMEQGPNIHLYKNDKNMIYSIVLKTKNYNQAKSFLSKNNLLESDDNNVLIIKNSTLPGIII